MVLGDDGPAVVAMVLHIAFACVDHGLDGEHHAGLQLFQRAGAAVVQNLGFFVEFLADAVSAELAHHREAVPLGKLLDGVANVSQPGAWLDLQDTVPHGFKSHCRQAFGCNRALANQVHAAVVAVPAVLGDDGHVHVHDVALFQGLVVGNAVAHHVVDRRAQRRRVGWVAWGLVAHGGGDGALLGHALRAQAVDLFGGDAGLDVGGDVVQHFRSQAASQPHALNVFGAFDGDAHGSIIPLGLAWRRAGGHAR